VEINPNEHTKKRRQSQSRTPQKQRDKENPPQLKKRTTTTQHNKPFNCYTINIRGLTQQKWKAILNNPSTKDPHAIVVTEYNLPFENTLLRDNIRMGLPYHSGPLQNGQKR